MISRGGRYLWTPDERSLIARVMGRLRMKPFYMPLRDIGLVWDVSLMLVARYTDGKVLKNAIRQQVR